MKRLTPYISACLSIDSSNAIAYDSKPVSHYAPKKLKDLDFTVFRKYLKESRNLSGDRFYVIGENTWNDMKGLSSWRSIYLTSPSSVLVVCKDGIRKLSWNEDDSFHLNKEDPPALEIGTPNNVFNSIMNEAIERGKEHIFVLGGAKVYDAFIRNADEIVVGMYEKVLCMDKKPTSLESDLYGLPFPDYQIALKTESEGTTYTLIHSRVEGE